MINILTKDLYRKKIQITVVNKYKYCIRKDLKCYCDENFVFSFPVFLSVIFYLDPKFHESAKFFTI